MIESLRTPLYIALAVVVFFLWQAWNQDHQQVAPGTQASVVSASAHPEGTANADVPDAASASKTAQDVPAYVTHSAGTPAIATKKDFANTANLIHVDTDTVAVDIDPLGGSLVGLKLKQFPESIDSPAGEVVELFQQNQAQVYTAQSGLQGPAGPDGREGVAKYQAAHAEYAMSPGQNDLEVVLTHQRDGLVFEKVYRFHRGSYLIDVAHHVRNDSEQAWHGRFYGLLKRSKVESKKALFAFPTYTGGAISSDEKRFEKISFDDMAEQPLNREVKGGWIAMVQHYFVSAWVPNNTENFRFYSSATGDNLYRLGMVGPWVTVEPGQQQTIKAQLYSGPEYTDKLAAIAPGLELTVDYGWFWPISQALFWVMKKLYQLTSNWGLAIIFVTVLIKACFYRLSASSYRSMANMRRIQPKLLALKDRYGDDKQKMSQATIELYRKEKINPLGGCLPILIQIPVFIALYWVLIESVELRQAPFYLWIHDLSTKDPFYVLPLIMGATMFLQQRLSPAPPDPMQAKVMMAMPVVFTLLFLNFPAGLMLYWVVNNSLSITQQWFITRSIEAGTDKRGKAKKAGKGK